MNQFKVRKRQRTAETVDPRDLTFGRCVPFNVIKKEVIIEVNILYFSFLTNLQI